MLKSIASAAKTPTTQVTPRDIALLRDLLDSRLLTARQIAAIHFGGSYESARKRLQKLKRARLVRERPRAHHYEPASIFLTRAGYSVLRGGGHLDGFPNHNWESLEKRVRVSPLTVQHESLVGNLKAAFAKAVRGNPDLSLASFITWPKLISFDATIDSNIPYHVKPDGFFHITRRVEGQHRDYYFYLEVDRSTETITRLLTRIKGYVDHYRSGAFAYARGASRHDVKAYPFRVLWCVKSKERARNLALECLESTPPVKSLVWIAVQEEVERDPLGTVFRTPDDYITRPGDAARRIISDVSTPSVPRTL